MTVKSERKKITPEVAAEWLKKNVGNRPLSKAVVEFYAACMRRGEWVFAGDPIRFDQDGNLIDGQHRLAAVVLSGVTVEAVVITGLARNEVMPALDQGSVRTRGHILAIAGHANYRSLAGALAWLYRYETGNLLKTRSGARDSRYQMLELLAKNPKLPESVSLITALKKARKLVPEGAAAFLHYVFSKHDAKAATGFFRALDSGADLEQGDPIYVLRETLLEDRSPKTYRKLSPLHRAAITVKAWNAFRAEEKVRFFKWVATEDFPEIGE